MLRRLGTSIAKSMKNSIRYYARESSSSCIGKSIIIEEFQQRSTSSFLSNYPNKWTTVRSFSSSGGSNISNISGGTGVDEISKKLAVPYVEQLANLGDHPLAVILFWLFLIRYSSPRFSPRFLKFMNDRLPYAAPYEDSFFCKIESPIHQFVTLYAFLQILKTIHPAATADHSYTRFFTLLFVTVSVARFNSLVEEYMLERNLPFSVGDTIKIRIPNGYLKGTVAMTGKSSLIWLTGGEKDTFILPYSKLSSTVIVRSIVHKMWLKIHDNNKISQISEDIIKMMRLDPHVSFEMGLPYCNCSQVSSYVNLTIGCDVKNKKSDMYIFRKAVRIIKEHGGELVSDTQHKAKDLLDWEPNVALRKGLRMMVADFRQLMFGDHKM